MPTNGKCVQVVKKRDFEILLYQQRQGQVDLGCCAPYFLNMPPPFAYVGQIIVCGCICQMGKMCTPLKICLSTETRASGFGVLCPLCAKCAPLCICMPVGCAASISLHSGMFARSLIYMRAYIRVCMYIQTYIYIGRSVYTIHNRGARGEFRPDGVHCVRARPLWVFLFAVYIRAPAEAVCVDLCALCGCSCSLYTYARPLRLSDGGCGTLCR